VVCRRHPRYSGDQCTLLPWDGSLLNEQEVPEQLISHLDPKSSVVEVFRVLVTNLHYASTERKLRSVLITSPGPGEGKSTIAANLVYVLVQSGMRVIAVAADLRKPTLHKYFGLEENGRGLSTELVGKASLEACLEANPEENLMLLPVGPTPPNPEQLRMRTLVEMLKKRADMVVIDAPPVLAVADASVMVRMVDGVLMVINVGRVPRELAKQSKEQLEKVGARTLDAVLNRVDVRQGYGYYYYYEDGRWKRAL
jgi:protein-tyrosine kinase